MMKPVASSHSKIGLLLMVPTVAALAVGTVVEKFHDNAFARSHVYGSWWFLALLSLTALYILWRMVCESRRPDFRLSASLYRMLLYVSVLLMLAGGVLTMSTGRYGSMTLQPGIEMSSFVTETGDTLALPFGVTLSSFEVVPYPGSTSPMDFVSHVLVDGDSVDISMNSICRHGGYRFYQEDYDGLGGSTLSVAHDPWGIALTYTGYLVMALGIVALFFCRNSLFRRLLRGADALAVVALLLLPSVTSAAPRTLPKPVADKMGQVYVLYKGRVCPLQTMAKDFTTKLCGSARYEGLTPEQVMSGWLFYSGEWAEEPMIKVKGDDVRQMLSSDSRWVSFTQLMVHADQLETRHPLPSAMGAAMMPSQGQMMSKTVREASEKYNLVRMLLGGKFVKVYPLPDSSGTVGWYGQNDELPANTPPDDFFFVRKQLSYCQELVVAGDFAELERVFDKTILYQQKHAAGVLPSIQSYRAERLYNRLTTGRWLAILVVSLGMLFFARAVIRAGGKGSLGRSVDLLPLLLVSLITLFLLLLFVLRWVAGGHAPMAGGFDSMNLMAIAAGIVGIALSRRHAMAPSIALFSMGFCLLVAMMSGSNPPVTHLMPVLSSPLLTLHVAVIMISYALFFFLMLNGLAALFLPAKREQMMRLGLLMLYPAVALLAVGIVIGAVWANISWGSYWSWDPKEVWALITLVIYLYPLLRLSDGPQRSVAFHLYCTLAFFSVIVTYFGVNLILGGIHAYN